jgi:hypothetical protein
MGVFAVPVNALFAQRGRFYVFTRKDGEARRTEVRIEDGNAEFAIVRSGLAEGDEVVLGRSLTPDDGDLPVEEPEPGAPPASADGGSQTR